eukprot:CAMPEP_0203983556 /NCGR_PEP_ID=MMETSP0360-20130528/3929_1 /ASSEMBLY_ACC=CAM_ASM_000342 /TAXON_ID=268821 /ORGANISM="Scrippsiella Hangoei, Strain SHTV-5" /LENGTH=70 /DNA_ID=CAMNT_0050922487 /DNA_START=23 /DNA_END=231 /DNA_ORIENTATION=+
MRQSWPDHYSGARAALHQGLDLLRGDRLVLGHGLAEVDELGPVNLLPHGLGQLLATGLKLGPLDLAIQGL